MSHFSEGLKGATEGLEFISSILDVLYKSPFCQCLNSSFKEKAFAAVFPSSHILVLFKLLIQSMEFSRPEYWSGYLSLLQGIFPTQGWNPGLPHCRWILYQLSHQGSPRILEWTACPFSKGSSRPSS